MIHKKKNKKKKKKKKKKNNNNNNKSNKKKPRGPTQAEETTLRCKIAHQSHSISKGSFAPPT